MSAKLINAAQAVIERWDSPQWNWGEPTAALIHELRQAVDAARHQGQEEAKAASVEEISRALSQATRHVEDDRDHMSNMLFNSIFDAVKSTDGGVVFNLKRFIKTLGQRGFVMAPSASQLPRQESRERIAELPQDVIDLVIAAREYVYQAVGEPRAYAELDKALEAFAARVPWNDEPDDQAKEAE